MKQLCIFYNKDLPSPEDFAIECLHLFYFLKGLTLQELPKSVLKSLYTVTWYRVQDICSCVDITMKLLLMMMIALSNCTVETSNLVLKWIRGKFGKCRCANVEVTAFRGNNADVRTVLIPDMGRMRCHNIDQGQVSSYWQWDWLFFECRLVILCTSNWGIHLIIMENVDGIEG